MNPIRRVLSVALFFVAISCVPSCKTTAPPDGGTATPGPTIGTVLVDCAKTIGGPVVGGEIPKIVTALTSDNVDAGLLGVVSDLTGAGFLTSEAIAYVACVVRDEVTRAARDSSYGSAPAMKRENSGGVWLAKQGIVFISPDGGAARKGAN